MTQLSHPLVRDQSGSGSRERDSIPTSRSNVRAVLLLLLPLGLGFPIRRCSILPHQTSPTTAASHRAVRHQRSSPIHRCTWTCPICRCAIVPRQPSSTAAVPHSTPLWHRFPSAVRPWLVALVPLAALLPNHLRYDDAPRPRGPHRALAAHPGERRRLVLGEAAVEVGARVPRPEVPEATLLA